MSYFQTISGYILLYVSISNLKQSKNTFLAYRRKIKYIICFKIVLNEFCMPYERLRKLLF